jgi:hypothetical protein
MTRKAVNAPEVDRTPDSHYAHETEICARPPRVADLYNQARSSDPQSSRPVWVHAARLALTAQRDSLLRCVPETHDLG